MWFLKVTAGSASSLIPTALEAFQRYECLAQYHHAIGILPVNVPAASLMS